MVIMIIGQKYWLDIPIKVCHSEICVGHMVSGWLVFFTMNPGDNPYSSSTDASFRQPHL